MQEMGTGFSSSSPTPSIYTLSIGSRTWQNNDDLKGLKPAHIVDRPRLNSRRRPEEASRCDVLEEGGSEVTRLIHMFIEYTRF